MVTELNSFRIRIDADARLAAAVGGAARFLADAAGMENNAVAQLQSSVVAACVEIFHSLTREHPHLQVKLTGFADRIEVTLSHHGDASPSVGLDSVAGFAVRPGGGEASANPLVGIDRVQHETHGEEFVTRLTKYVGRLPPGI